MEPEDSSSKERQPMQTPNIEYACPGCSATIFRAERYVRLTDQGETANYTYYQCRGCQKVYDGLQGLTVRALVMPSLSSLVEAH